MTYGFKTEATFYKWVRAFSKGSSSEFYSDILTYCSVTLNLADFTPQVMDQIIGDFSLMYQLNNTFSNNIGFTLGYKPPLADEEDFINDQWRGRLITSNPKIPLWFVTPEAPLLDTIYELY